MSERAIVRRIEKGISPRVGEIGVPGANGRPRSYRSCWFHIVPRSVGAKICEYQVPLKAAGEVTAWHSELDECQNVHHAPFRPTIPGGA
jgi:hypothetical protein